MISTHRGRPRGAAHKPLCPTKLAIERLEHRLLLANDIGFSDPVRHAVGNNPERIAVADLDADGFPDLVTANFADQSISVLRSNADGTFQPAIDYPTGGSPNAVAVGDVNGDGWLDAIATNLSANNVSILLQLPDGFFGFANAFSVGVSPQSIVAVDVNRDGQLDLIVPYVGLTGVPGGISVLYGKGRGDFQRAVRIGEGLGPESVAVADLNDDGHLDIAAANGFAFSEGNNNDIAILLGSGDGTFADPVRIPAGNGPNDIAIADVNGDGVPDLVSVNDVSSDVSVLIGEGGGNFAAAVNYPVGERPGSLVLADLNGNGHLDIAVANRQSNDISTLINRTDGTFIPQGRFAAGFNPLSIVTGNFNDDLLPDLAVATQETDEILVLVNTSTETSDAVLLDGRGAVYEQLFDAALGVSGVASGVLLPSGWTSVAGGQTSQSITQSFPVDAIVDGTYNAGADGSADRALATNATTSSQMLFDAEISGGDARAIRLAFDIETWLVDPKVAANPGEAAFNVVLEADTGSGYQEVVDFGRVSTDATLRPPPRPLGTELWKTDGTNVSLVADITPGESGSGPNSFAVFNDALYFWNRESILYKFDGSEMSRVGNFCDGGWCNWSHDWWLLSDGLYYEISHATRRQNVPSDLFLRIDESGTTKTFSNDYGFGFQGVTIFRGGEPTVFNDDIYLVPHEHEFVIGEELWKFDGEQMLLVADINTNRIPGDFPKSSSSPFEFTEYDGELYFVAGKNEGDDWEIFKTDGDTVEQVTDIGGRSARGSWTQNLTVVGDKLFFEATDGSNNNDRWLWTFDGTTIEKLPRLFQRDGAYAFRSSPISFNDQLYFFTSHAQSPKGLWKSDGTTTTHIADLDIADLDLPGNGNSPWRRIVFDDALYFDAIGADGEVGLWKSDGLTVSKFANLRPSLLDFHNLRDYFTIYNNELYFLADDGRTGQELWKTDGTNVTRVTDISPGLGDSFSCTCQFAEFNGELYFAATNGGGRAAIVDGNADANRFHFDSGPISADIPVGAKIRLRFARPGDGTSAGYVVGLDNVQFRLLAPGDSDGDGQFDQQDIVAVLQADKYLSSEPATFSEGDWNRDGFFNQLDVVAALQTNNYLQGPYAVFSARDDTIRLSKSDDQAAVDQVFQHEASWDDLLPL